MRIACLQFAPQVGAVRANMARADTLLDPAVAAGELADLDLLVLPEMALSGRFAQTAAWHVAWPWRLTWEAQGYNFASLEHITPYLESPSTGPTATWARSRARALGCVVVAGYPEKAEGGDGAAEQPGEASPSRHFNAATVVDKTGRAVANYRKAFLYYTDETWATEGGSGFFHGDIAGLGRVALGICMDIKSVLFPPTCLPLLPGEQQ